MSHLGVLVPTPRLPKKALLERKLVVEARPEMKRLVVVALVVVELVAVKSVRVEDAVETKPFKKARVVEVACSPEERVVNG